MDLRAELARMHAETEQANETMKELAGTTRTFFQGLMDAGFCEDHALQLTQTWLAQLIQSAPMSGVAAEASKLIEQMSGEHEQ
jgi:hypothetical protein